MRTSDELIHDEEILEHTTVWLAREADISVNELTRLVMNARYDAGEYDEAHDSFTCRYLQAHPRYEHFAARLVEGTEQADLRRVIRIAKQDLAWRVGVNDDDGPAEVTWSTDGDKATAMITDRRTGRTTPPAAGGARLSSSSLASRLFNAHIELMVTGSFGPPRRVAGPVSDDLVLWSGYRMRRGRQPRGRRHRVARRPRLNLRRDRGRWPVVVV